MLKEKALRRIFIATVAIFVVLTIYSIVNIENDTQVFKDAYYIKERDKNVIYSLNKDNYIARATVYIDIKLPLEEKVKSLLEIMTSKNNKNALLPSYFKPILPVGTQIKKVEFDNNILKVTFNNALINITKEQSEKMLEAIIYTLTEFEEVHGIELYIDNKLLKYAPNTKVKLPVFLDRNFGVNKVYNIDSLSDINKVFLYYISTYEDNTYYIPVTKYVNGTKEKLEIIVEELSNNYIYEKNLSSYLDTNLKLDNYFIQDKTIKMIFKDSNEEIREEAINTLSLSIFDNYDINKVIIVINDKVIEKLK